MSSYKNILFPFDSKVKSRSSFAYALELAQKNQSNLIFLHTVRFNKAEGASSVREIRQQVEDRSVRRLQEIQKHSDHFQKISYEFHTEIGFIASRVILKMQEFPIDLLLIEKRSLSELNGTAKEIDCPIMVIPDQKDSRTKI